MANLTQISFFLRKWGIFAVLTTIVVLVVFFGGKSLLKIIFPVKPAPATVAFGKIPKLDFKAGFIPKSAVSYKIETISGDLPALLKEAKVIATETGGIGFGTTDKIKARVAVLGFTNTPTDTGNGSLRFVDPKDNNRVLIADAASGNFKLTGELQGQENLGSLGSQETVINTARAFFNGFGLEDSQYPDSNVILRYFDLSDGKLVGVLSAKGAKLAEVRFYHGNIDGLASRQLREDEAYVKALVSARQVINAEMNIPNVAFYKYATYPLKGTIKAFEDLKAGLGAFSNNFEDSQFAIRDVVLAYLFASNEPYIQPIYVFKGETGVDAYVAAVDDKWVNASGQ